MLAYFFNDAMTTKIYTLSLHDALPIYISGPQVDTIRNVSRADGIRGRSKLSDSPSINPAHACRALSIRRGRSEEHTSELQSRPHLVCRLLLEKKKNILFCDTYHNLYYD